ncbi:MAG: carbamoyltransferase [Deltaproteobacteria bacterium]|nr:carbamoyltransferase [Deltaproteobacteria bacterium]
MFILGINAAFHDSAAALIRDGKILAAAEEERFTRIKHAKRPIPFSTYELPYYAIDYCLSEAGISLADVHHVGYSFDPYLVRPDLKESQTISLPLSPSASGASHAWEPLFLCSIVNAPRQLSGGAPHHIEERFRLGDSVPYQWHFLDHHLCHAASAFYPSPFDKAAVLTLDGRGELATTTYSVGEGRDLERISQVNLPHSLGLLYEEVTRYLGFLHSSDEFKVMALASYGQPVYVEQFRSCVRVGGQGQYSITPLNLSEWFGPARFYGAPLENKHFNLAHSLQVILQESVLEIAGWLHNETGCENLCIAGGVGLNCVLNNYIREQGPFEHIWVQPAAGDAGTALGAALWLDAKRGPRKMARVPMDHAFFGPEFSDDQIEDLLISSQLYYRKPHNFTEDVAALLANNKVIGWFEGRMEFGPRALGARSILASPRSQNMQQKLNRLKDREDFRPVAPVILEEEAPLWFRNGKESPFMLFVTDILPSVEAKIPAVRHIDRTARVQTVNNDQNPLLYELLRQFYSITGIPLLVNTSFNVASEPIVCRPADALRTFFASSLDALAIGPFILEKTEMYPE